MTTNKKKTIVISDKFGLRIGFVCGECGMKNNVKVLPSLDLTSWNQECDLCGSHSETYLTLNCVKCGRYHKIILDSN